MATPETQELCDGKLLPLTSVSIFELRGDSGTGCEYLCCLNTFTCELLEGRGYLPLVQSQWGWRMLGLNGFRAIVDTFSLQTDFPPSLPLFYPPFLPSLRGTAKVAWGSGRTNRPSELSTAHCQLDCSIHLQSFEVFRGRRPI